MEVSHGQSRSSVSDMLRFWYLVNIQVEMPNGKICKPEFRGDNMWCIHAQSCSNLYDAMDCSPPASSVHGIFQARVLEWVAISYARWSSWPNDQTWVSGLSWIGRHICYQWANWKALRGDCLILNKSLGIFSIQMKFKIILLNEVPSKVKFR